MKVSILGCVVAALLLTAAATPAPASDVFYTVSSDDDYLRVVNPLTGGTTSSIQMSVTGATISRCNGLAIHPTTNEMWVIINMSGQQGRVLGKVNAQTGVVTTVGNTGDAFANIAFDATGQLYGVTGDGANTPETLYSLSLTNGAASLVMPLGNGIDGEAIAFNPIDGFLYHGSGFGPRGTDQIFEKINYVTMTTTNIPITGVSFDEPTAMMHLAGGNILMADLNADLILITDQGVARLLSSTDHTVKGMAFLPTRNAAYNRVYGFGCAGPSGTIPAMLGQGTPNAGGTASLAIVNGPAGATCILGFGLGNGNAPLAPGCVLQIMPLTPTLIPLSLDGNGQRVFSFGLPPSIVVGGYWQAAVFEGSSITLTNALEMQVR